MKKMWKSYKGRDKQNEINLDIVLLIILLIGVAVISLIII